MGLHGGPAADWASGGAPTGHGALRREVANGPGQELDNPGSSLAERARSGPKNYGLLLLLLLLLLSKPLVAMQNKATSLLPSLNST